MITVALYNIRFEALENILTSPSFTLSLELVNSPIELTDHYFKDFKCALLIEEAIALNYFPNNCLLGLIIAFAPKTSDKDPILLRWEKAHTILHPFLAPMWYIFLLPEDLISKQANMRVFREIASRPYHEIGENLNKWEASVETNLGGLLTALANPNIRPYVTKATESKANYRLASLALAIAAYQAKKGRYPAQLDNLVPDYITKIPTDPFDGKPLKVTAIEGGLVLYSVGVNGVDDGGEEYNRVNKTGDITFCLGKAYKDRRLKPDQ